MKKIINIITSVVLALGVWVTPAAAAEVEVSLPTFPVTLNGVLMEQGQNEYPCLVYKDITYVAMTYYDARLLGLVSAWQEETGLIIKKADFVADQSTLQGEYVLSLIYAYVFSQIVRFHIPIIYSENIILHSIFYVIFPELFLYDAGSSIICRLFYHLQALFIIFWLFFLYKLRQNNRHKHDNTTNQLSNA